MKFCKLKMKYAQMTTYMTYYFNKQIYNNCCGILDA